MPKRIVKMGKMVRLDSQLGCYISIPGGWKVVVGIHRSDEEWEAALQSYYSSCGMEPKSAKIQAMATVQRYCEYGYIRGLREAVMRSACDYARRYPHLRDRIGTKRRKPLIQLKGFRAEEVQKSYVPFKESPGRHGSPYIRQLLADMAEEAE